MSTKISLISILCFFIFKFLALILFQNIACNAIAEVKQEYNLSDANVEENCTDVKGVVNDGLSSPEPRLGLFKKRALWRNGFVPFVISLLYTDRERKKIRKAMRIFHRLTSKCIKFVKRKSQRDYILITKDYDCSSKVGRKKQRQIVSLASHCLDRGTILHELNHAVGFDHEHVRPDRDEYIEVLWDNFENEDHKAEMYITKDHTRWSVFNESYDLYSLMHYGPYAFSYGKMTIRARDSYFQNIIGQSKGLSAKDIRKIRKMYKCKADRPEDVLY